MNADEIRAYAQDLDNLHDQGARIIWAEIAAQLAELNAKLDSFSSHGDLPRFCVDVIGAGGSEA